ncbi:MAG: DUF998 domain-containing protein [Candidatus Marinimicrobia bacterium]|nr:DUF998 domain-containing protein [Candidatus Neomarinimicrobiota bacterium]
MFKSLARQMGYHSIRKENPTTEWLAVSFLTLRRVIGLMGLLFPVVLAVGCVLLDSKCSGLEPSISAYYGTIMRNVFVGVLFTIGWFLFSYKGYENADDIAGDLACLFALGVALFPITNKQDWVQNMHLFFAASLFITLAYFSLVLFTKSDGSPTPRKKTRNQIYKTCGWVMLSCIVLILVTKTLLKDIAWIKNLNPTFWLETFTLWAFGVSWMTKGKLLWADVHDEGQAG